MSGEGCLWSAMVLFLPAPRAGPHPDSSGLASTSEPPWTELPGLEFLAGAPACLRPRCHWFGVEQSPSVPADGVTGAFRGRPLVARACPCRVVAGCGSSACYEKKMDAWRRRSGGAHRPVSQQFFSGLLCRRKGRVATCSHGGMELVSCRAGSTNGGRASGKTVT